MEHALYLLGVPFLARMISDLAHSLTGIDIDPAAQIDGSFFIDQDTGVMIGETAIVGQWVRHLPSRHLGRQALSGGRTLRSDQRQAAPTDRGR
jgi:serine O-acetyltransferase